MVKLYAASEYLIYLLELNCLYSESDVLFVEHMCLNRLLIPLKNFVLSCEVSVIVVSNSGYKHL